MPKTNEGRWPILVAPSPYISRAVWSQLDKHKQENEPLHPLYEQDPARKRLKSRHSFLHSVEPLDGSALLWSSHLQTTPHKLSFSPKESLPPGSSEASHLVRLHRPWTGTGRCKALMQKWGFNEDGQTACECGDEHTKTHLQLVCPHPATTMYQWRHGIIQPAELDPALGIGREYSVVTWKEVTDLKLTSWRLWHEEASGILPLHVNMNFCVLIIFRAKDRVQ